ncbi:MAG: hypothetical protein ABIH78_02150 [Candidatus Peregrinibacteria bacterium]
MQTYFPMTLVVLLIIVFLLVVFVFVKISRRRRFGPKELQYIKSHWIRIIDEFSSHPAAAVMDADKILDYALLRKGFEGSLGEKLRTAGPRFTDLDGVWRAHKLRNRIAHELSDVDRDEAKRALKQFKTALNDLGAEL